MMGLRGGKPGRAGHAASIRAYFRPIRMNGQFEWVAAVVLESIHF